MKSLNEVFKDLNPGNEEMSSSNMGDCMVANCNSDIGYMCYATPGLGTACVPPMLICFVTPK